MQGSRKAVPASFKLNDLKIGYEAVENQELAGEVESAYGTGKPSWF